jgi:ComF family protein
VGKAEALRLAVAAGAAVQATAVRGAEAIVAIVLAPACVACERVLEAPLAGPACAACLDDARRAGGHYDGALRLMIHAFKYDGRRSLARPLAAIICDRSAHVLRGADCLVPVPLHPWRRLRRGFNQAADLARQLDRPVIGALWRVRSTAAQAGLTASARRRNVRGAFRLSPLLSAASRRQFIDGRVVVLVDDVITTGATLGECAGVLTRAGAREVRAVTLARAPLHTQRQGTPHVGGDGIAIAVGIDPHPRG